MTSSIPGKADSLNLAKHWMMRSHSQTDVNWPWEIPLNRHSTVRKIEKGQNGEEKNPQCPFFVKLSLIIKKFTKWPQKLCKYNPQQFALESTKPEGFENAKEKQPIKKTYYSF